MNPKNVRLKYKRSWQFPEVTHDFIKSKCKGKILHVCCGNSDIGDIRMDIEWQWIQDRNTFVKADMFHIPLKPNSFDTVICDPVWNLPYHVRHKLIYQLRDMVKLNGILIFNCLWFPHIKCMEFVDLFVGLQQMAFRNVSLIGIYKKTQEQLNKYY